MFRAIMKYAAVLLLAAGIQYSFLASTANAETIHMIITAEADAYVQKGSGADLNFGSNGVLALRGDRHREAFVRFDLSEIAYPIISAELQLDGGLPGTDPATNAAYVSNDSWDEFTITHNTRPAAGADIAVGERAESTGKVVFNVTAQAVAEQTGDGKLSMLLYSTLGGTTSYNFQSKETAAGFAPRLVVAVDTTARLLPEADAYVQKHSGADNNYGGSGILALRGDRYREAFIRFDLSQVAAPIVSAKLQLDGGLPGGDPATSVAFVNDDTWDELTITHNTRPLEGADIAAGERIDSGGPVEFDVTESAIAEQAGDGKLSMLLYSTLGDTTSYNFHSKESTTGIKPRLIIETAAPSTSLLPDAVATVQRGAHVDSNFAHTLVTKYNNKFGYVRYDVSNITGSIISAKLRLAGNADLVSAAFVANDAWHSETITYNNAPASGAYIATGSYGPEGYTELDVTAQVRTEQAGDGQLSLKLFTLANDGNNYLFGAYPELVITALYTPVLTSVTIEPGVRFTEPTISIPLSGTAAHGFVGKVRDQNGGAMEGESVSWSVAGSPAGVSVSATGEVVVSSAASAGIITLQAASDSDPLVMGTFDIELLASHANPRLRPYALYDQADLTNLRSRITAAPFLGWYANTSNIANRFTSAELDDIASIYPWRTFTFTFQAPANAATADFSLHLHGKGSVRFDNLQLIHIGFDYEPIDNMSFEEGASWPNHWAYAADSGSPQFVWEDSVLSGIASEGVRSVSITNSASEDKGRWATASGTSVVAEHMYSLQVDINQEEWLEDGVYLTVEFKDAFGLETGEEQRSLRFNTITPTRRSGLGLAENAVVYAMTGDTEYADKALQVLTYTLEDMQYRISAWLLTSQDPDQSSRAVHIGRAIGTAALAYDMIADSGVMTADEDNRIRSLFYWIADKLMDKSYYNYDNDDSKRSNFNSDRAAGLGIFALVFPEYAKSSAYLAHAVSHIEWQLDNVVGGDGGWPETIRYHQAVMDRWIAFAKMLNRSGGTNLFNHAKFKGMFEFLIQVQTPRDTVSTAAPNQSGYPAIGDHTWREAVHILGMGAAEYLTSDPTLSKQMMFAWQRAGAALRSYYSIMSLTAFDPSLPVESPNLGSMVFQDMGYVLFRSDYDQASENYMIIVGSDPQLRSHQHADRGSFSLYADSTPLSLDPGVSSYGTGVNPNWFQAAQSHNVVQFKDHNGLFRNGPVASTIEDVNLSPNMDYTRIAIPDTLTNSYKRHIAYVKLPFQAYVIWDQIDSLNESRIHYHTLSDSSVIEGSKVTAHGYNNKDLEISFVQPGSVDINKSIGSLATGYPQNYQEHFTVDSAAGEHYLTLLYPKDRLEEGLTVTMLSVSQPDARAYKVSDSNGSWFVIVVNNGTAQNIDIETDDSLIDSRSESQYANAAGTTTVSAEAHSIHFFAAW